VSRSLRKSLLSAAAVAVLTAACSPTPQQTPAPTAAPAGAPVGTAPSDLKVLGPLPTPNGDDRPPIIIGDGSIDVYIDKYPGGRGQWTNTDGKYLTWEQSGPDPSGKVSISHFDLDMLNTKKNPKGECADPDQPYATTALTLNYGDPKKTVQIGINTSQNFQVVFPEKAAKDLDPKYYFWLYMPSSFKLDSVKFFDLISNSDIACEFNNKHRAIITIRQSSVGFDKHPQPDKKK
jgi:hypothetical protein